MTQPTPGKGRGRKPVDLIAASNYSSQEIVWAAIRELKTFTASDLISFVARKREVNDGTIKSYLARLAEGGYFDIEHTAIRAACRTYRYTLVRDTGVDAPRLTRHGTPSTQGLSREQIWRAMRILGDFTYHELQLTASTEKVPVKASEVRSYIKHLYAAGYLAETKPCVRGTSPKPATYRLLPSRYTGPRPPMVQRVKQVFDPNLGKVMCIRHRSLTDDRVPIARQRMV